MHQTRAVRILAGSFLFALLAGCGASPDDYEGPKRYALTGKVTFNGSPVDGGTISFIPPDEDTRPCGATIVAGQYAIPEAQGANEAQYRVEIRWLKPTGKQHKDDQDTGEMIDEVEQVIPATYNDQSTLTADVSASSTNFDFVDLSSK
jgi:hypothetical protein